MFWQKRKVKQSIPEEIVESTRVSSVAAKREASRQNSTSSIGSSADTCATQLSNPTVRRKKLNWMINMIVETIEENIQCEPVTIKLKTPKVRRLLSVANLQSVHPILLTRQTSISIIHLVDLRFLSKHINLSHDFLHVYHESALTPLVLKL